MLKIISSIRAELRIRVKSNIRVRVRLELERFKAKVKVRLSDKFNVRRVSVNVALRLELWSGLRLEFGLLIEIRLEEGQC